MLLGSLRRFVDDADDEPLAMLRGSRRCFPAAEEVEEDDEEAARGGGEAVEEAALSARFCRARCLLISMRSLCRGVEEDDEEAARRGGEAVEEAALSARFSRARCLLVSMRSLCCGVRARLTFAPEDISVLLFPFPTPRRGPVLDEDDETQQLSLVEAISAKGGPRLK